MQDSKGNLNPISAKKFEEQMQLPEPKVFREQEILEIRGARFRVEKIYKRKIVLKSLPALKTQDG